MAQIVGTTDTLDIVGIAEDIEDAIFNISPMDTPFLTMAKRKDASNTNHQWQTDSLASTAANKQIEGDDASFTTATPTTMLSNRLQIARKTLIVSDTADVVRKYGRARETARLVVKYGKELKRDMEYALVRNQASSVGGSQTARSSAGLESMIAGAAATLPGNGISYGGGAGTTPGYQTSDWTVPTDGTAITVLTEAMLKTGIEDAWEDGGNPSVIMLPFAQKARVAGFTGATKYAGSYMNQGKAEAALIGAVDVYISDAGEHKLVLNRHVRASTVFGIDPDYVSVAFLRGIRSVDLAKTGDATKKMMLTEFCLVADNPDAHFKIADLTA